MQVLGEVDGLGSGSSASAIGLHEMFVRLFQRGYTLACEFLMEIQNFLKMGQCPCDYALTLPLA